MPLAPACSGSPPPASGKRGGASRHKDRPRQSDPDAAGIVAKITRSIDTRAKDCFGGWVPQADDMATSLPVRSFVTGLLLIGGVHAADSKGHDGLPPPPTY